MPNFAGIEGESTHQHLKAFYGACSTLKPHNVPDENFKLKAFTFTLIIQQELGWSTKNHDRLLHWKKCKEIFGRNTSAKKATWSEKELAGIKQKKGETLFEYLERFRSLKDGCNHLRISETLLVQYLLDGKIAIERKLLDCAAGGTVMNKSPDEIWELIEEIEENYRVHDYDSHEISLVLKQL